MADDMGAATSPAFEAARIAYEHAEAEYEAAVMSGVSERRIQTRAALRETATALARARAAWLEVAAPAVPSFEDLLRDPCTQMDPAGLVLASIRSYKQAAGKTLTTAARQPVSKADAAVATSAIYVELAQDQSVLAAGIARWQREEAPTPGRTLQHT